MSTVQSIPSQKTKPNKYKKSKLTHRLLLTVPSISSEIVVSSATFLAFSKSAMFTETSTTGLGTHWQNSLYRLFKYEPGQGKLAKYSSWVGMAIWSAFLLCAFVSPDSNFYLGAAIFRNNDTKVLSCANERITVYPVSTQSKGPICQAPDSTNNLNNSTLSKLHANDRNSLQNFLSNGTDACIICTTTSGFT
jgi:hypothetical protein